MFFRALTVFRLAPDFKPQLNPDALTRQIEAHAFRSAGPLEMRTQGWVPPMGRRATDLLHSGNGCVLLCLQMEDKLLPSTVIRQALEDQIIAIEDSEAREVGRKERMDLKERITVELMPRAFGRIKQVFGYLDTQAGMLVLNTTSAKDIEAFTEQLRKSLDGLPIKPLDSEVSASEIMTGWLLDPVRVPVEFELGADCELEQDGVIRCRDMDLTGDEVRTHLNAGRRVRKLALTWNERLAFVLSDDLRFRRVKFLDLVQEDLDRQDLDSPEAPRDAEFAITSAEVRQLLVDLSKTFG